VTEFPLRHQKKSKDNGSELHINNTADIISSGQ